MKTKTILAALLSSVIAVTSLSACANPFKEKEDKDLPGKEIVRKAMDTYNKQNSGGIEVWDISNDKLEERFIYWYDEVGMLTYYSEKATDDGVYKEYSTGYNLYVEEDGVGSLLPKTDERVIFYDKEFSVHGETTDAVFYFSEEGVETAELKENEDGSGVITYVYDAKEAKMGMEEGKLDSFKVEYYYDTNEVITHFVQTATGEYDNGDEYSVNYRITLIPSEEVGPIDNPIM